MPPQDPNQPSNDASQPLQPVAEPGISPPPALPPQPVPPVPTQVPQPPVPNVNTPQPIPANPNQTVPPPSQFQMPAQFGQIPPEPSQGGLPKWLKVVLIGVATLVIVGGVLFYIGLNSGLAKATDVSNRLVNAVQANDAAGVSALTSDEFKEATPDEALTEYLNVVSPELQGEEQLTDKKIESDSDKTFAAIKYAIETSTGKRYIRVVLVENDGDWEVQNFRPSDVELELVIE